MDIEKVKKIEVMRNSIKFLRICSIFPTEYEINHPEKNVHIRYTMMNIVGSYFPIGIILHLINNIKKGTPNYMDEDIMMLLSYLGVLYFSFRFFSNVRKIVVICKQLSDFDSFGKPENFNSRNKLLNKIAIGYFIYHFVVVIMISMSNVFLLDQCKTYNEMHNIDEICGMIGRIWLPFNYDYFPVKQFFFIWEIFFALMIYQNAGIISFFMFESIEHMNLRFRHLSGVFVEVLQIQDPIERRKQFVKAVQYHYALIELGNNMNICYSPCCMVHIFLTAPVLGATGYRLVTAAAADSISLFVSWIISTSLACTGGQRLQDACESLGDVLYQVNWYNLEKELQKDIMLVILRARKPIFVKAGPFGNMTYAMMVAIGKASYSYLTYLQTMI